MTHDLQDSSPFESVELLRRVNHKDKIQDVLEALGDELLATSEILPRLKIWAPTMQQLTWFITSYMVNQYVMKYRNYSGAHRIVKFQSIVLL